MRLRFIARATLEQEWEIQTLDKGITKFCYIQNKIP